VGSIPGKIHVSKSFFKESAASEVRSPRQLSKMQDIKDLRQQLQNQRNIEQSIKMNNSSYN
jgi:hypothetical protein